MTLLFTTNPPPASGIYPLSLHDALPILIGSTSPPRRSCSRGPSSNSIFSHSCAAIRQKIELELGPREQDRKSTRLNSSHITITYAVFCLKKKTTRRLATIHAHILHKIDT